jgi:3-isopropylmalate dehydrogenase
LLLVHALGRADLARDLERAIEVALVEAPTPDVGGTATTAQFTEAVVDSLSRTRTQEEAWTATS